MLNEMDRIVEADSLGEGAQDASITYRSLSVEIAPRPMLSRMAAEMPYREHAKFLESLLGY